MPNYASYDALGKYIPNISYGHAMLEIFTLTRSTIIIFQSTLKSFLPSNMATPTLSYDATFLIQIQALSPEVAVVHAVQHSLNTSSGSFIILRTSPDPTQITFGAQVGWLLGFCGRFAILKLFRSGLPGLRYLMITASWLQLDRFEWDLQYYELMGGLPSGSMFYTLTLTPLRWVLENGEWRTTYGQGL